MLINTNSVISKEVFPELLSIFKNNLWRFLDIMLCSLSLDITVSIPLFFLSSVQSILSIFGYMAVSFSGDYLCIYKGHPVHA